MMNLRDVLTTADISVTEASVLFGVHRVTVHGWISGKQPRSPIVRRVMEKMTELMEKGIAANRLPIHDVKKSERLPMLRRVLRDMA